MKTTQLTVTEKPIKDIETDLLVYFALQIKDEAPHCDPGIKPRVDKAFSLGDFKAEEKEDLFFYPETEDLKAKRVLVAGLGKLGQSQDDAPDDIPDALREAGGRIAKACKRAKAKTLTVCLPDVPGTEPEVTADVLAQGILLGDYRFDKYKETSKKETDYAGIKKVRFSAQTSVKQVRKGAQKGVSAAMATCTARDMANEPGNNWTSKEFADYAKALAKTHGLTCKVLEKKDLEKLSMNGILAVNQGSAVPPRLVILEYKPAKKAQTIMLVGKGITFDSGGISLKPAAGMEEMKYDMCGGAAVLCAMQAVGAEKPDVGVVALIPATDNMSGSKAIHPGDIIRHFNGVTSEVVNTDAEGRLILADALAYGIKTYKPDCVIDAATLTGAVIIGLGHHHTGMVSNNDALSGLVEAAGKKAGEPVWRLPLTTPYMKQIESKVADIKNVGGRPGGTITAAAYLSKFVDKTPWAHLDIAGTAWDFTEKSYIPKGPSGTAVRTFLNLIRDWDNPELQPEK